MAELEGERECRICRGEDEPGRPLLHPCRCSGSIKYTHEDCLVNWLAQSGSSRCELCNHSFRFEPLYQPNTPSALPTKEFVVGVLALTRKTVRTVARIVLVFTVWLFCLPLGTCWTWYALFINSPSQLPALLASRGISGIATDAFYGFLLSAAIVFIFLGVSSLREYVRHFPHEVVGDDDEALFGIPEVDIVPENIEDYDSDENLDETNDFRNQAENLNNNEQQVDDAPNAANLSQDNDEAILAYPDAAEGDAGDDGLDDQVFDEFDELVRDTYEVIAGGDTDEEVGDHDAAVEEIAEHPGQPLFDANESRTSHDDLLEYAVLDSEAASAVDFTEEGDALQLEENEHDHVQEEDVEHHEDDLDHRQVDEEDQAARGDGGAIFGLFELDPDEVPLEMVVGLRGHIRNLFDNACTVLLSNAIFLGVFTLIPLLIGRLTIRLFSAHSFHVHLWSTTNLSLYSGLTDLFTSIDVGRSFASKNASMVLQSATSALTDAPPEMSSSALVSNSTRLSPFKDTLTVKETLTPLIGASSKAENAVAYAASHDDPLVSYVDSFLIVFLGYGMIALIAVAYIGTMSMLRQRYPRLDSPFTRQIARMLRYVATFVKIVVLILFEFGIFPLGCGWWLDICTLELFGGTLQSRLAYCQGSPWTCTAGHWILGIVYMIHISLFISLLREVVKPELLWFLRNPDDPEFHPFRELVEKPLSRHARRMCISVVIYVPLILALVYIPGQICLKGLPNVFPFRSEDFSHIFIDVPFGNLLIGPLIRLLYFGRPEVSFHRLVALWIIGVSSMLGIQHLVVKDEDIFDEVQEIGMLHDGAVVGDLPPEARPLQRMFVAEDEHAFADDDSLDDYSETQELDPDVQHRSATVRFVRLRASLMILFAWLTLVVAQSALLALPTILGRSLMSAVGLPVRHDLHPCLLGLNVLLGTAGGLFKVVKYIQTVDTLTVLSLGLPYLALAGKATVIVFVWLGVIPLVAGLLFELILVPIRVPYNETPYFCLHQDWALGLLLLKVWSCIAVAGGLGTSWRERVLRARAGDMIGLDQNFSRTMREVVLPVLVSVVTALSVPYSVAKGLLPMLGVARWVSNLVYRYAYLVVTCYYCSSEATRYSLSILRDLHDSIRDDKYLVGKRLYNFIENADASLNHNIRRSPAD